MACSGIPLRPSDLIVVKAIMLLELIMIAGVLLVSLMDGYRVFSIDQNSAISQGSICQNCSLYLLAICCRNSS